MQLTEKSTKEEVVQTVNDLCKTIQSLCKQNTPSAHSQIPELVQSAARFIEVSRSYMN